MTVADDPQVALTDARFWIKVDKRSPDECWPWLASRTGGRVAYGQFQSGGYGTAHRYAYARQHGTIPEKHEVAHTCHNGLCVNPAHLVAMTHGANEQAKDAAARRPRGPSNKPCRKCGGPLDGHSKRGDGRTFRYCKSCKAAYFRSYVRR